MKTFLTILLVFIASLAVHAQEKKTEPAPMVDTIYFISGTADQFAFLFAAIAQPDDVTANEKKALLNWIRNKGIVPRQKPPADKPKN